MHENTGGRCIFSTYVIHCRLSHSVWIAHGIQYVPQILAEKVLTRTAWAYYRSTADDEASTYRQSRALPGTLTPCSAYFENHDAFKRFWFRPRV